MEAIKKGEAVRVVLPEAGTDVVLLKVDRFEEMRGLAEDKALQRRWLEASHESAVAWMKENPY
ncbi:MAG: hypothetical protein HY721_23150 [Planctomycetes bacterium]|nr:hypothetical protein [Planctomycetota bacterium]